MIQSFQRPMWHWMLAICLMVGVVGCLVSYTFRTCCQSKGSVLCKVRQKTQEFEDDTVTFEAHHTKFLAKLQLALVISIVVTVFSFPFYYKGGVWLMFGEHT